MTTAMKTAKTRLLGVNYDNVTLAEALAWIEAAILERAPKLVMTPNSALVVWADKDPYLKGVYERADLVTPDGMGVFAASRLLGKPVRANLPAVTLALEFLPTAAAKGYSVYLLGARPGIPERAARNLETKHPGLKIVGTHHGYFDWNDLERVVDGIAAAKPDLLLIGMSTPQKEKIMDGFRDRLNVPVTIGVGGMIDIAAGVAKLAPPIIRWSGTEWLYRLIQEPRRLWRRYLETHPYFIGMVLQSMILGDKR